MSPISLPFSGAGPLLLFLAKATVILIAALVAAMTLRRSTAGARHLVWLTALVGVLALPLLSRVQLFQLGVLPSSLGALASVAPAVERDINVMPVPVLAPVPPVPAIPAVPPMPARARAIPRGTQITVLPAPAPSHRARAPFAVTIAPVEIAPSPTAMDISGPWSYSLLAVIVSVWGVVALVLTGWLVAGAVSVRRIVRSARELTSPDWTMPLCEVADRLDLELPPRLVLSDRIEMAFACRALAPTIVLPAAAESWSDDRRRAVLFHELAHIKRHDLHGHTLGRIACALYWFHPLIWTAAKHLRAESERACDDLVLRCGARPSEYAQHLLDMVTTVRNYTMPIMALPMARKKEFEGRMLAILDPEIRRASPGPLQAVGIIAMLAILSVTVAAVAPADASPIEISESDIPVPAIAPEAPMPHESALEPQAALLIRILETDADASVRKTAAWGLNEIDASDVRAALTKALRADGDAGVREMAAWALAEQGQEDAASALADALRHDKSAQVRSTAAWGLGELNAKSEASALESGLSDAESEVRETSIWAFGQLGLSTAPRALVNSLRDNSKQVRLVAAWALGEIEDKSTVQAIINAFQTETDNEIRGAELRALAAMGTTSPAIVDIALKSTDPELRKRAVSMLAGHGAGVWVWPWPWPRPRPYPE